MTSKTDVTLYLRTAVPAAASTEQQTVIGRLKALQDAGLVDDLRIEYWPSRVRTPAPTADPALTLYDDLTYWAGTHSVSLDPSFSRREYQSQYTGTQFTMTSFPVMCLAISYDDQLAAVYPNTRHGQSTTVMDGLAMLEAQRQPQVA